MGTIYVNVDIDVDDIIGDINTEDLIDELESRGYEIVKEKEKEKEDVSNGNKAFLINRMFFNKHELYRHLCDICDCGYHEPKDLLLKKINEMI